MKKTMLFLPLLALFACSPKTTEILSKVNDVAQIETVTIGSQVWTVSNLNVSTYRNGDKIPQVQNGDVWKTLTTGAWCYYNNDASNGIPYGKLYNWYAVNDPRGLAPNGYHIPTDAEWKKLSDYINSQGKPGQIGTKMKSASGWNENGYGTNSSGFTGLPGGYRNKYGVIFEDEGKTGNWWSSSEAMSCQLAHYNDQLKMFSLYNRFSTGLSVRCIKD
jgi:uncharacterized protein (TIGR02145 family)